MRFSAIALVTMSALAAACAPDVHINNAPSISNTSDSTADAQSMNDIDNASSSQSEGGEGGASSSSAENGGNTTTSGGGNATGGVGTGGTATGGNGTGTGGTASGNGGSATGTGGTATGTGTGGTASGTGNGTGTGTGNGTGTGTGNGTATGGGSSTGTGNGSSSGSPDGGVPGSDAGTEPATGCTVNTRELGQGWNAPQITATNGGNIAVAIEANNGTSLQVFDATTAPVTGVMPLSNERNPRLATSRGGFIALTTTYTESNNFQRMAIRLLNDNGMQRNSATTGSNGGLIPAGDATGHAFMNYWRTGDPNQNCAFGLGITPRHTDFAGNSGTLNGYCARGVESPVAAMYGPLSGFAWGEQNPAGQFEVKLVTASITSSGVNVTAPITIRSTYNWTTIHAMVGTDTGLTLLVTESSFPNVKTTYLLSYNATSRTTDTYLVSAGETLAWNGTSFLTATATTTDVTYNVISRLGLVEQTGVIPTPTRGILRAVKATAVGETFALVWSVQQANDNAFSLATLACPNE